MEFPYHQAGQIGMDQNLMLVTNKIVL